MKRQTISNPPSYKQESKILDKNWNKYQGNIVMVIKDKIYATKKPSEVKIISDKIIKKYGKAPLIAQIPDEGTLILYL